MKALPVFFRHMFVIFFQTPFAGLLLQQGDLSNFTAAEQDLSVSVSAMTCKLTPPKSSFSAIPPLISCKRTVSGSATKMSPKIFSNVSVPVMKCDFISKCFPPSAMPFVGMECKKGNWVRSSARAITCAYLKKRPVELRCLTTQSRLANRTIAESHA